MILGPKCGAAQIDSRLHDFMEYKFKEHFKNLPAEDKKLGSPFMKDFEYNKRIFDQPSDGQYQSLIPMKLIMRGATSRLYRQSGHVVLTE
jgi:hypothetical protein